MQIGLARLVGISLDSNTVPGQQRSGPKGKTRAFIGGVYLYNQVLPD